MNRSITFKIGGGNSVNIQTSGNESMNDVISKLSQKTQTDLSSSTFLYSGKTLNRSLTFENLANNLDKKRNQMNILVFFNDNDNENTFLIKSKEIICPTCKELCKINIYDYKIALYDCKNNHKIPNISFNDFDKSQMIDESNIICNLCKQRNKKESYKSQFYYCKFCNINICPLCNSEHSKSHGNNMMDYEYKNFFCKIHNRSFHCYCIDCKKDICMFCEREHFNHYYISYGSIFLNSSDLNNKLRELRDVMDNVKNNISEMNVANNFIQYFENYIKISEFVVNNYNEKKINFFILYNLNVIHQKNEEFSNELKKINDESDVNLKSKTISDILKKIEEQNIKDNDMIYPEDQSFLHSMYNNSHFHHTFFPHGPHFRDGPHDWYGPHGPHHWDGPHGPHDWDGPHGPHDWDGPHGPHHWGGPHGPHHWDGPHGPHDWDGPHGPHDWDGPHGPHHWGGPHGPHHWGGPHGPHNWDGPHGPHH